MRKFFNQLGNLFVPFLLRSPLHFLLSGSVMLVTFTGRSSGKVYTTPVEYLQEGSTVSLFTRRERVWWKNLQNGAAVTVRVRGRDRRGHASASSDPAATAAAFQRLHPHMSVADDFAATTVMVQIALDEAPHQADPRS